MAANDVGVVDTLTKTMAKVLSSDIALVAAVGDILLCRGGCPLCHRRRDADDAKTKPKYCEALVQCLLQRVKLF